LRIWVDLKIFWGIENPRTMCVVLDPYAIAGSCKVLPLPNIRTVNNLIVRNAIRAQQIAERRLVSCQCGC